MCMVLKSEGKYMAKEFIQKYNDGTQQEFDLEELQRKCKVVYPYQDIETAKLEGEQWKPYPYFKDIIPQYSPNDGRGKKYHKLENLYVSNKGRVKVKYKDKKKEILEQIVDIEGGYLRLPEYPGFGNVYRLVAETWLERPTNKDKNIVHHIDNNGYNNSAENLIWVDKIEHGKIHGLKK